MLDELSETQRFYLRAYEIYENDISIENILRSLRKLESGLAAVIGDNQELI